MKVLAGDIGGTKTRLAIFETDGRHLEALVSNTYPSPEYASLDQIIKEFLAGTTEKCRYACFGIAGPVRDGKCRTTNLPWEVNAQAMSRDLGYREVSLLNDLEASAWGIPALGSDDLYTLNTGIPDVAGNASVISAGTGLGEAGMFWGGDRYYPFASEGGHTGFSPGSELEVELLLFLRGRFEHVSWERIVSGPGLANLYEFLSAHEKTETPAWLAMEMKGGNPAAAISEAALVGRDPVCVRALDLFVYLYGVEAGNHALKIMSTGGVYLGGGIAPKILDKLKEPGFLEGFTSKGRMSRLLRDMPVKVILNDRTSLYGPALYAARNLASAARNRGESVYVLSAEDSGRDF